MRYKIIDYSFFGNIVLLYLGNENIDDWTGEDWNNLISDSYEPVDQQYVVKKISLMINPEKLIVETFEDELREEFTKNDMKTNKFPFMSIMKQYGNFWAKDSRRYCLGDIIDIAEKKKYITIGY